MKNTYEADEQKALFAWAESMTHVHPELALLHHIPNGGKRDKITAVKLKAEGVKSGVPDVCLPVARGGYHGFYIELKVGSNKPTDNQWRFLVSLQQQGYAVAVCYSWVEASEKISRYLDLKGVTQG